MLNKKQRRNDKNVKELKERKPRPRDNVLQLRKKLKELDWLKRKLDKKRRKDKLSSIGRENKLKKKRLRELRNNRSSYD